MDDVLPLALYAVAKFLGYGAWCYVVLRPATIATALRFGALRWFIGLGFGVVIFFAVGSVDQSAAARTYFFVYSPVRLVEWGIMAALIGNRQPMPFGRAAWWCTGGMLVSFLSDLLSPDGVQGRFCVGRCLC